MMGERRVHLIRPGGERTACGLELKTSRQRERIPHAEERELATCETCLERGR